VVWNIWIIFLVGGLESMFYDFPYIYIGNVIIPTDEVHHFSEGYIGQPPTSGEKS
jgi:hypothetical protein